MGILISVGVNQRLKFSRSSWSKSVPIPGSGRFAATFGLCAADLVGPTLERANEKYERAEALETGKEGPTGALVFAGFETCEHYWSPPFSGLRGW